MLYKSKTKIVFKKQQQRGTGSTNEDNNQFTNSGLTQTKKTKIKRKVEKKNEKKNKNNGGVGTIPPFYENNLKQYYQFLKIQTSQS